MRIAYMLTSLGIGGAERQVISIGERMAARGHDIALIILKPAEEHEWPTTLPVYRLGMTRSAPGIVRGLTRARRMLRELKPALLHSHTFHANILARSLRAVSAAPMVLSTIHNIYEGGWHRSLAYRITDAFCRHSTAVSQAIAAHYKLTKAASAEKMSVITNGIDTGLFSRSSTEASASPHEGFRWLAAGRDVPAKDFDNLLSAFETVRAAMAGAQLCIAGKPASHRSLRESAAGVRWLGVSEAMPRTLAECDAFVLSSAWEGLPLVLGEAMAMEKPVVATDVGGVRELISDTGIIVPSRNPAALADAMLRLMRIPESERCAIGRAGRKRVLQHFDLDVKVSEWESLYAQLLSEN